VEFLNLVWTSFVSIVAPLIGTIAGILGLIILSKIMKSFGLKVDQQQLGALADAAGRATKAVEAWSAKKMAASGASPSSKEKADKAVSMVKTFLSNNKLYDLADNKITEAIEAKLGEQAVELDDIVTLIQNRKKGSTGN
jgi:hypothetical protein